MDNKTRTFIALTIPVQDTSWIAESVRQRKTAALPKLKWVAESNLHVTLKFLGDLTTDKVRFLQDQVPAIISKYPKFEVTIGRIGAYPDQRRPKVLWLGMEAPEALFLLQKEIDTLCLKIGVPKENRPFSAHITLARVPENCLYEDLGKISRWIIENRDFPTRKTAVESVIIFKSELKPDGPIYSPIKICVFE
ncbi:MAG: RNA 2',3'-cyclic phosphodiesterase [Anaerolineaceae bacterium]|nr:RNA 2',3'-cyclic phosphodiesterase [Anaerolineaceae bacterium]